MLDKKIIRKIKIKLIDIEKTPKDLAKELKVSDTSIYNVLNNKKDLPNIEQKLLQWIQGNN